MLYDYCSCSTKTCGLLSPLRPAQIGSAQPVEMSDWDNVLELVQRQVKPRQYETWFRHLRCKKISHDSIVIEAPNEFCRDWLARNHLDLLASALDNIVGVHPPITLTVAQSQAAFGHGVNVHLDEKEPVDEIHQRLNPNYTFENFVVGPSNRLSHAAALAVVDNPGKSYNPLFIHGEVGLGKTHLVHAVCHELLKKPMALKVLYLSCEAFVNDYITAIKDGSWEAFRFKYRNVDVLLVDDIHFLGAAEHTQEEFFHTFNALYNAQKQILVTSDCAPHDLPSIQERLVSRFKWGLVARIEAPAYETRVVIVQRKAQAQGVELSSDIVQMLASAAVTNIRELQGAITRVVAHSRMAGQQPTERLVREVLHDLLPEQRPITVADIINVVCDRFGVRQADLLSRKKSKSIVFPRQICMHIARRLTRHSLEEIGGFFGGRDHTTVMHADDKIRTQLENDDSLNALVNKITEDLQAAR